MSPSVASVEAIPKIETPTTGSRGNPVGRSFHSSAPVMRLPSGHKTDHWSWSLSDPGLRMAQMHPNSKDKADEDDDLFLFPLGSSSLKTPSPCTTLPSSYFIAKETPPSSEKATTKLASEARKQKIKAKSVSAQPLVNRTRSFSPAPRLVKAIPHPRPARRSQSITLASMKSARRRHNASTHMKEDESTLRRQVADLTQRVTMLLANQCAACRLGIIQCGLQAPRETTNMLEDEHEDSDDGAVEKADVAAKEEGESKGRDRQSAPETGNGLEMLARQARMMAYG